ncbi:MAG: hypothetical protein CSA81_00855 [Acidobacteria bacterium]|nr:MAG: hypothetical protein CSA81_00855 [Acidobacteriota bacterium]
MNKPLPLAERLRPGTLQDVLGQSKTVSILSAFVKEGDCPSMIFWGPPGSGKTTLCRVLAKELMWDSAALNATSASVKDIRNLAERASLTWEQWEKRTLVFIDEIHRLNKSQQDVLLPFIEDGTFVLLGSTTENPYFSINAALRSRVQLMTLTALSNESIETALKRAGNLMGIRELQPDLIEWLSIRCGGDLRAAYSALEGAFVLAKADQREVELNDLKTFLNCTALTESKGDNHYDLASAYQKSLRGSDANAAVYYLARFLLSGEDPRFIARRLLVTASEDVGMADPFALVLAEATYSAVEKLGMPEARIPLTQTTIYVANAPKNNSAIASIEKAAKYLEKKGLHQVPGHLKDPRTVRTKPHQPYLYTHKYPHIKQDFLPEEVKETFIPDLTPPEVNLKYVTILEEAIQDIKQDWTELNLDSVCERLDLNKQEVRMTLNYLVKAGRLEFKRLFRLKPAKDSEK